MVQIISEGVDFRQAKMEKKVCNTIMRKTSRQTTRHQNKSLIKSMFVQVIHQELKEFEEYLLDGSKNSRKMITEIFNCLHLLCFQPFFKANPAALHEAS